jgi:hypothetical protein
MSPPVEMMRVTHLCPAALAGQGRGTRAYFFWSSARFWRIVSTRLTII